METEIQSSLESIAKSAPCGSFNDKAEEFEGQMLAKPQVDCPLRHMFAPGVYLREITMPAGTDVLGHEHKTEHFNVVMKGKAEVMNGKEVVEIIEAPYIFKSGPGVRKALKIIEEMVWVTVHVTDETEISKLDETLIQKSDTFINHQKNLECTSPKEIDEHTE